MTRKSIKDFSLIIKIRNEHDSVRVNIEADNNRKKSIDVYSNITLKLYNYEIINEFSHDISHIHKDWSFIMGSL